MRILRDREEPVDYESMRSKLLKEKNDLKESYVELEEREKKLRSAELRVLRILRDREEHVDYESMRSTLLKEKNDELEERERNLRSAEHKVEERVAELHRREIEMRILQEQMNPVREEPVEEDTIVLDDATEEPSIFENSHFEIEMKASWLINGPRIPTSFVEDHLFMTKAKQVEIVVGRRVLPIKLLHYGNKFVNFGSGWAKFVK
ncbi:hypothetical protein LINPERHAP2_LOCUS40816, partial [Linum perenne]